MKRVPIKRSQRCAICRDTVGAQFLLAQADGRVLCPTCQAIDRLLAALPRQPAAQPSAARREGTVLP
jgi:uncharacterized Zn finger protein (UPF0148 family)